MFFYVVINGNAIVVNHYAVVVNVDDAVIIMHVVNGVMVMMQWLILC